MNQTCKQRFSTAYNRLYVLLAGSHPNLRRWHFQWLAGSSLYPDLKRILADVDGRVLDVGCAEKPYAPWAPRASQWFGIDVYDGPQVDALMRPGEQWPVDDGSADLVLCAAVLSHVVDLDQFAAEIDRVLVPGGIVVVTVPFVYNEVKMTEYWRFTRYGIRELLSRRLEIVEVRTRGGIGSVLGLLLMNWIESSIVRRRLLSNLGVVLLPARLLVAAAVNTVAPLVDRLDETEAFYLTTFIVAQKQSAAVQAA